MKRQNHLQVKELASLINQGYSHRSNQRKLFKTKKKRRPVINPNLSHMLSAPSLFRG